MKLKTSVAVACFLPGRVKHLSATLKFSISDIVLLPTVLNFQVSQPYNSNCCYGVTSYSHAFHTLPHYCTDDFAQKIYILYVY